MVKQIPIGGKHQQLSPLGEVPKDPELASSSNYLTERRKTIDWLRDNGYPPIPVAPAQDPYKYNRVSKTTKTGVKYCPLTSDLKPEPLFTGKNPSYLDRGGKPHLLNHRKYQNQLPKAQERKDWFANPLNGVGTLGGWNDTYWSDLDSKKFQDQSECDCAFNMILERQPDLQHSYLEKTQSGGYRIAVKCLNKPDFTNFALEPGDAHVGELLGAGRFTVLAPTVGPSGNPYVSINRAVPVEVNEIDFVYSTKTVKPSPETEASSKEKKVEENQAQQPILPESREWIPGSINLELLLNQTARDILAGNNVKGDRSSSLTTLINEAWGWYYWCRDNNINVTGTVEELAHYAGGRLGIDSDRVERILFGINADISLQPAAHHLGGDSSCWKKIYRLDRATFESLCPAHIKDSIKSSWNGKKRTNQGGKHKPEGSEKSDDNSSNNGSKLDDNNSANWFEPKSYLGTIGYWKKVSAKKYEWQPRCNFDFIVERELTSESGGGFVLQVKPETEQKQYRVLIKGSDLASPDSFVDALKRALGFVVVCSLSKRELNALIAAKQAAYRRIRGGQKYRACDRYGQQEDGTWVFENIQFTSDGNLITEKDTLIIFDPQLGVDDFIPPPRLAEPNSKVGLSSLIDAGREVFGKANINQFLLTIGWVIAALNFQTIIKIEGHFPIFNAHGVSGSCKTIASEAALSLVGINWPDEGMISNASSSAIYERLSKTGNLPIIWDDPPRKDSEKIDEFCKAMWNAKSRVVRGNHQKPHSPVGFTTNHLLAGNQDAAWTRIFRCLYEVGGNIVSFPKLKAAMKIASGSFSELLKIGYHPEKIQPIQNQFLGKLPFAHARISWTLGLITWYAEQVVKLVGGDENPRQWVLDNLIESENDSEYSGDSLADFARCLMALEGKDRIGSWNKREYTDSDGVKWIAIHAQSCWEEVDKAYKPTTYNKKSLKAILLKSGGKQKTVRFDMSRDLVLDYQRELRRFVPETYINDFGEKVEKEPPRPPKTKYQKAWLIPSKYFDPPDDGVDWGCDQNQEDVTNCDQNLVTGENDGKSSASASEQEDVTIVTKKEEEEEEEGLEKNPARSDLPTFGGDPQKNSSSSQRVDFSPEKMVTMVTESKTTEIQTVQPMTNSGHNWSHPVTLVTTEFFCYPYRTSNDEQARRNRAMRCKQKMLACTNSDELRAFRASGGFDNSEIQWVWENLLTADEKQKVPSVAEQLPVTCDQLPVGREVSPSGAAEATPCVDSDVTDVTDEQENVTYPEKSEPTPDLVTECVEAFKTVADVDDFHWVCEKYPDIYDQAWKLLSCETQGSIIQWHESLFGFDDEFLENCLRSVSPSPNPDLVTECVEAFKTVADVDDFHWVCEQYPDIYDQAWKLLDNDTQRRIIQLHESLFGSDDESPKSGDRAGENSQLNPVSSDREHEKNGVVQ